MDLDQLLQTTASKPEETIRMAYESNSSLLIEQPLAVYKEHTKNTIEFNVMPNMSVKETITIKEYRLWANYAEATFDRQYFSQMTKSPDHFIFLSALVHLQKMLYVYVVHNLGLRYDPFAPEKVKFWPTDFKFNISGVIRRKENLVQKMLIQEVIEKPKSGGYEISGLSKVGDFLQLEGRCAFFILKK